MNVFILYKYESAYKPSSFIREADRDIAEN